MKNLHRQTTRLSMKQILDLSCGLSLRDMSTCQREFLPVLGPHPTVRRPAREENWELQIVCECEWLRHTVSCTQMQTLVSRRKRDEELQGGAKLIGCELLSRSLSVTRRFTLH